MGHMGLSLMGLIHTPTVYILIIIFHARVLDAIVIGNT
jgi:hypothetical protein